MNPFVLNKKDYYISIGKCQKEYTRNLVTFGECVRNGWWGDSYNLLLLVIGLSLLLKYLFYYFLTKNMKITYYQPKTKSLCLNICLISQYRYVYFVIRLKASVVIKTIIVPEKKIKWKTYQAQEYLWTTGLKWSEKWLSNQLLCPWIPFLRLLSSFLKGKQNITYKD